MKKTIRAALVLLIVVLVTVMVCGCTVKSGVFIGFTERSSDTSLSASYASFDGSLARRVSLKAGDMVRFRYEGGEGLRAAVRQSGNELCEITDGATFTAPEDGTYSFGVEGKAKDGSFSISWQTD